jgi:conjugal transfer pilus assembly protein TraB
MANIQLNRLIKSRQMRMMSLIGGGLLILSMIVVGLLADAKPKKHAALNQANDLTGIIDESFTEANADSAMTAQQGELESLKTQLSQLTQSMKDMREAHDKEALDLSQRLQETAQLKREETPLSPAQQQFINASTASNSGNQSGLWHNGGANQIANNLTQMVSRPARIHTVSFRRKHYAKSQTRLNPNRYVPSNTSVRAVILGGADADASVNGQSKNNGVMLFKFLEDGTLPNGQHSRLRGCRVSGNAYGDISSERAFATLYKISCAHPGEPIIDKEVTGWVFFNGKVGVKGVPLMRDNKIMQWAGISGALSGIASAAQYAQSVQSISSFGAASVVPQSNIGPYAAYGGASKAADVLSQYYVKRAEQYHPVIQVGSGNVVTIVFKDGFYLEPTEDTSNQDSPQSTRLMRPLRGTMNNAANSVNQDDSPNFNVPPEVLGQIDNTSNQSFASTGVQP